MRKISGSRPENAVTSIFVKYIIFRIFCS
jgi:hypothetical protein